MASAEKPNNKSWEYEGTPDDILGSISKKSFVKKEHAFRKVKFRKAFPGQRQQNGKFVPGGKSDFIHDGLFHRWADTYEEFETGIGNYTYALIELPDGSMEKINPIDIKFL